MPHKSHTWKPGTRPAIRPHSREKHKLLEAYLGLYVDTLAQNIKVPCLRLTIVDGFAGGNIYSDRDTGEVCPGSPTVILEALREAERRANERRKNAFTILDDYFFIEKNRGAFQSLEATLKSSGYSNNINNNIFLFNEDFTCTYRRIIEFINKKAKSGRAIFVLDQCGYSSVPLQCIREIFSSVKNAEVILTFAADSLIDYLRDERPNRKLLNNPDLDLDVLSSKVDKSNPLWRSLIQLELHGELKRLTGATFYTPFFLYSKDAHRDLWLVHLSRHHIAKDVMVGVHWEHQNSFVHYGKPGLNMLGYNQAEDILVTGQQNFPGFFFDGKAKALTEESLTQELPKLICDNYTSITFKDLFAELSNQMPANRRILRNVIRTLSEDTQLFVKDETGKTQRVAGVQKDTDVIHVPRQRRLFMG